LLSQQIIVSLTPTAVPHSGMRIRTLTVIHVVAVFILVLVSPLHAQNKNPFDSLDIGFQYVLNTNRNTFHEFWNPGKGYEGCLSTPFYFGDVHVGIQLFSYSSRTRALPGFESIFIYSGWGKSWMLPSRLTWFNGISVGSNIFIFENIEGYGKHESELSTGIVSRLHYPVSNRCNLTLAASYRTIFTYKPINLAFLSLGTTYSITTPKWLKVFLE